MIVKFFTEKALMCLLRFRMFLVKKKIRKMETNNGFLNIHIVRKARKMIKNIIADDRVDNQLEISNGKKCYYYQKLGYSKITNWLVTILYLLFTKCEIAYSQPGHAHLGVAL